MTATVVIPTYNGEDYLRDLLTAVFSQKITEKFDVLIIDSGSTDRTLDIIKDFPKVRLHKIPNSEFGHGKTRNLAAEMANGEFLVYLSQDAVPSHNRWLEFMLEPFMLSDKVFCVFGKQVPRPHCDAVTKREVSGVFNSLGPDHSIMINRKNSLLSGQDTHNYLTFFSDVNSAVRRDYILNKIPYRDVRYSEDQLLGKDVLEQGYLKAYAPKGSVYHSNEYRLKDYYRRKFDEYLGMYDSLGVLPGGGRLAHIKRWLYDSLRDIPFIIKDSDYSLRERLSYLATSWLRNYYRQRASLMVMNARARETGRSRLSLEAQAKKVKNDISSS